MYDLSILIPARNEEFLKHTIDDILANIRGNTEIIVVLDGYWPDTPIEQNPKVTIIHLDESIGQRAACNLAARLSKSKYLMKVDAHCAFDEGFDVKLLADMRDDWAMVPVMRNLHAFDWVCKKCGGRKYQGPTPTNCTNCDNTTEFEKDIVWIAKTNPQSRSYCFDSEPHFQYFGDFTKRPEGKGEITETMSLQGSCFLVTREKYFELNLCDEAFGSWGTQGAEVAIKTWLSGGRVVCNQKTWYAHMFRTQGGDFGFPYQLSGSQVDRAKKHTKELFFNNNWPLQIKNLSWLVEKFWPVPGWSQEELDKLKKNDKIFENKNVAVISSSKLSKGLVYYTDNRLDENIMTVVQKQILSGCKDYPIISVSLKPIDFGDNIVLNAERGYLTMFKQILTGLEASTADIIFFTEHDILYHEKHFDFTPPDRTKIYYNQNIWHLRASDGHMIYHDAKRLSQLCAFRDILIEHYKKRVELVEKNGFTRNMGFEPGSHGREGRVDDLKSDVWVSEFPNVDIKHGQNLTESRWRQDQFRSPRSCRNWQEADSIPYWGDMKVRFPEFVGKG